MKLTVEFKRAPGDQPQLIEYAGNEQALYMSLHNFISRKCPSFVYVRELDLAFTDCASKQQCKVYTKSNQQGRSFDIMAVAQDYFLANVRHRLQKYAEYHNSLKGLL